MSIPAAETVFEGAAKAAKVGLSGLWWLPWATAAGSLAIGAGGTLWYRSEWKSCQASVAIEPAKAQEKVNAEKAADAKFKSGLEEQLKPIISAIQDQANATHVAFAKVKSDPSCLRTPAAAAFDATVVSKLGTDPGNGPARRAGP